MTWDQFLQLQDDGCPNCPEYLVSKGGFISGFIWERFILIAKEIMITRIAGSLLDLGLEKSNG
jgi:hypothetical protein